MAVELRKGQKVNLEKPKAVHEDILINLNWSQPTRRGFFSKRPQPIDLDLGCLYELSDGSKSCVQALGKNFGSLNKPPYISLDGDDRTGSVASGENLRISGAKMSLIRKVLVYTFIYEGIANWKEANGVVTIKSPGNQDIIVRMDAYDSSKTMCAIAMIENHNGIFTVEKLVEFFNGHSAMDKRFGWGLRWVPGKKD
ncbi:MAG: Tellurium resistance [Acutalibacteraceae bacterium]